MKVTVTIAGSDPSAGAGVQADLRAFAAQGVYGTAVLTAVTAQNSAQFAAAEPVPAWLIRQQAELLFADFVIAAIKSGMLGNEQAVITVAEVLEQHPHIPYVLDPVLNATAGDPLIDAKGQSLLRKRLIPRATLVTPNAVEAAHLTGCPVVSREDAAKAGCRLLEMGADAVLITGGHTAEDRGVDLLVTKAGVTSIGQRIDNKLNIRGTGCSYAAAIAARLAHGESLEDAVRGARTFIDHAARDPLRLGGGASFLRVGGPSARFFQTRQGHGCGRLHVLTDEVGQSRFSHAELAAMAADGGADVVQLREKRDLPARQRLKQAVAAAEKLHGTKTRLMINDRLDVALACGAVGVHLGADDLSPAIARDILGGGSWIGATANNLDQVHGLKQAPIDYIGVGPVYGTRSKENPAETLGLTRLREMNEIAPYPLVAIGNITPKRVSDVIAAGAYGIAVLSAVTKSRDPVAATVALRRQLDRAVMQCREASHRCASAGAVHDRR